MLIDKNIGIGINVVNEDYNISYPSIIKQAIKYSIINELKDEELRILYVALTRAKEKLLLTCARQRTIFGSTSCNPVSRFVEEIPVDRIRFVECVVF